MHSGKGQWKPGGSSLQSMPGLFLQWPSKPRCQLRNPVPGLTSSPLTSMFHNQRNPSPVAYFKSSFKAASSGVLPHSSLSGTAHCSQATQIHSCNKREPLDKQLSGLLLFRPPADVLRDLLNYQGGCVTGRGMNTISNQKMNCQVQV